MLPDRRWSYIKPVSLNLNLNLILSATWSTFIKLRRIYVSVNLVIIGSDNGLSPFRRQPIIWTNARLLWIGPLGRNFNEISVEI